MFKRVSIKINYARSIPVEVSVWVQDNKLHYSNVSLYNDSFVEDEVSDIVTEVFDKKLTRIGIENWKVLYIPPEDYMVLDGESWIVTYENDDVKRIINGENAYPDNWKNFIKLIRSVTGKFVM